MTTMTKERAEKVVAAAKQYMADLKLTKEHFEIRVIKPGKYDSLGRVLVLIKHGAPYQLFLTEDHMESALARLVKFPNFHFSVISDSDTRFVIYHIRLMPGVGE